MAQFCSTSGNVIIFANYDGGALNISIDEDIPDLHIGVCTYENCEITITGPFASNVTEVRYVGQQGDGNNCPVDVLSTTIVAPVGVLTDVLFAPASVLADSDGYSSMICAYSCGEGNQGGCNTAEQVVAYFLNEFGGSLYYYFTQYGCWASGGYSISTGGNCCPGTQPLPPVAAIDVSESQICAGDCIIVSDASTGNPTQWDWAFEGAVPLVSTQVQDPGLLCFNEAGTFSINLNVSNTIGSASTTLILEVSSCGIEEISGCMYPQAVNYNPTATVDDLSCEFICNDACPGDFDDNGLVGVSDLLLFISLYGSTCPN
jgi:hypothetical protein